MKKRVVALCIAFAMLFSFVPEDVFLIAAKASEYGLRLTEVKVYQEDGELYSDYSFRYNEEGQLTHSSYAIYGDYVWKNEVVFKYDSEGRLISRVSGDPNMPGANSGEEYTFNGEGQLIRTYSWEGGATETLHEYDAAGNRIRSTAMSDPGVSITVYEYDSAGILASSITTRSQVGSDETWQDEIIYSYDLNGRVVKKVCSGLYAKSITSFDYSFKPFVVSEYSEDGGYSSTTVTLQDKYGYTLESFQFTNPEFEVDSNGCLSEVVDTRMFGDTTEIFTYIFSYDGVLPQNSERDSSSDLPPTWNKAYYEYIVQDRRNAQYSDNWEYVDYQLLYLDEDTVPELWITYQNWAAGCRLVSFQKGKMLDELLGSGDLSYSKRKNSIHHSYGHMGMFVDTIFKIEENTLVTVAEGRNETTMNEDGSQNYDILNYYWNENQVDKETYSNNIAAYVNPTTACTTYDDEVYSYTEILDYLSSVVVENEVELKVYTSFPYTTLGVNQTAKLLVMLYVNGEKTPIGDCSLGNNNTSVIDVIDTKESDGVRVFTFETYNSGIADISFTEGTTGATVTISIDVEEKVSHYRCSNFPVPDVSCSPIHIANFQCEEHDDKTHTIKFNAYNMSYAYGAAIVYTADGKFYCCVPINPRSDGTGFEYIANGFWQSWEQTQYFYDHMFSDGDMAIYEVDGNAMETQVILEKIPANAKIVVTADPQVSEYVALYTGMDIFLKYVFYASNIDLKISAYQDTLKAFILEFLNSVPSSVAENTIQTLTTEISLAMVDGINSEAVEKIYTAFINAFGHMVKNADEILEKALASVGYATADSIIISAIPLYSVVDFVNKATAVTWPFVDFTSNQGCGKMEIYCIQHGSVNQLVNSDVSVTRKSEFNENTILEAYKVVSADEVNALPVSIPADSMKYDVYNITLRESGKEIQPGEEISIRVPLPNSVNGRNCAVYRIESNGTMTQLPSEIDGKYISFVTTHLSYYVVGQLDLKEQPIHSKNVFMWIIVGVSILVLSCVIILLLRRKSTCKVIQESSLVTDEQLLEDGCYEEIYKEEDWLQINAEAGDANSQYELGVLFATGKYQEGQVSQTRDMVSAVRWFKRAAAQGHADSQYALGKLYQQIGEDEKAVRYYLMAAKQNHCSALTELAMAYGAGRGVKQDLQKAHSLYYRAAKLGDSFAEFMVGQDFFCGNGVEKNTEQAVQWYIIAAKAGEHHAQYELGLLFEKSGKYDKAMIWYQRAAAQGNAEAILKLKCEY